MNTFYDVIEKTLPIIFSYVLPFLAFFVSLIAFRKSSRNKAVEVSHGLHANLFKDPNDYSLLYGTRRRIKHYYFSSDTRGDCGNFLGTADEIRVDNFLERLNFICLWLMSGVSKKEEALFRRHIHRIYEAHFFREYLSFLDQADRDNKDEFDRLGESFPNIHKYAKHRLRLDRPSAQFASCWNDLPDESKRYWEAQHSNQT